MHYSLQAHQGRLSAAARKGRYRGTSPLYADACEFARAAQRACGQGRFDYARLLGVYLAELVSRAARETAIGTRIKE